MNYEFVRVLRWHTRIRFDCESFVDFFGKSAWSCGILNQNCTILYEMRTKAVPILQQCLQENSESVQKNAKMYEKFIKCRESIRYESEDPIVNIMHIKLIFCFSLFQAFSCGTRFCQRGWAVIFVRILIKFRGIDPCARVCGLIFQVKLTNDYQI